MAARQSGKCLTSNQLIDLEQPLSADQNNQIPISDMYYIGTDKPSLIDRIKKFLYKIYNKL